MKPRDYHGFGDIMENTKRLQGTSELLLCLPDGDILLKARGTTRVRSIRRYEHLLNFERIKMMVNTTLN